MESQEIRKTPKVRKKRRPLSEKERACQFYVMGLSASNIQRLTGIPKRTVEGYAQRENWTQLRYDVREREKQAIIKEYEKSRLG